MHISSLAKFWRPITGVLLGALILAACSKSAPAASADEEKHAPRLGAWTEDYAAAVKQAKAEKKKILLDFTGSDWCVNCFRLDDGVFSKPEFADFAKTHYVLVTLDFPAKRKMPDSVTDQNAALMTKYMVQGLPTVVLLDADENKLVSLLGYRGEDAAKFIDELEHPSAPAMPPDPASAAPMPPATPASK